MVLKGGTAIAVHHVPGHRDSEDLDFDVDISYRENVEDIVEVITSCFEELVERGDLISYSILKQEFGKKTPRYHVDIKLLTYKSLSTKVDIDFKDFSSESDIEYDGKLGFYNIERMLISKLSTFIARKEVKDIYDIRYLVQNIDSSNIIRRETIASLIDEAIPYCDKTQIELWQEYLSQVNLRFKVKEKDLPDFIQTTIRDLRIFRNSILKYI